MKSNKLYKYNLILDFSRFDYFKFSKSKYDKIIYDVKSIDHGCFDYISIIYNSKIVSKDYFEILFKDINIVNKIFLDLKNDSIKNSIIQINNKISYTNIISLFFIYNNHFANKSIDFQTLKFNINKNLSNHFKKDLNIKPQSYFSKLIFFQFKDGNIINFLVSLDRDYNFCKVSILSDIFFDQIFLEISNNKVFQKKENFGLRNFIFIKTFSENISFVFGIFIYILIKIIQIFYKNKYHQNKPVSFNEVINKNISLLRWGDGESSLFFGRSIYFQRSSLKLQFKLINLIINHKKNINRFRIVYPSFDKNKIWNLTNKLGVFIKNINFSPFYFRENPKEAISIINNNLELFSAIIYVGNESPFKTIKHKFLFHVRTNSANCFEEEEEILKYLSDFIEFLEHNNRSNSRVLLLFGCGPLSKVLIPELIKHYPSNQYIDTGHLISILKI